MKGELVADAGDGWDSDMADEWSADSRQDYVDGYNSFQGW